jgi:hypothetical protein
MEPPFNQMDKIIDGLYLGNIEGASNMVLLKKKVRARASHRYRASLTYCRSLLASNLSSQG